VLLDDDDHVVHHSPNPRRSLDKRQDLGSLFRSRPHAANYSRDSLGPEVQRTALFSLPSVHVVMPSRDVATHVIKTGSDILWRHTRRSERVKLEMGGVNRELREPIIQGDLFLASSDLGKEFRRSSACSHAQAALPFEL
jgi:hypothetical protein